MSQYLDLYSAAEKWLGVPFRWHGHTKDGCDCIGLIIGILHEKNTITDEDLALFEQCRYGHNLSRICEQYVDCIMMKYFNKYKGNELKNGLVFRMKDYNALYHFAIYGNGQIIHTTSEVGCVFQANFDDNLKSKVQDIFVLKDEILRNRIKHELPRCQKGLPQTWPTFCRL
ncbi:MAG: C40 family peptidase [Rickettsiales bacterium]|nr:C40 family peptidase [Rickettsiales bacterium]